jgi:hypothetical protein
MRIVRTAFALLQPALRKVALQAVCRLQEAITAALSARGNPGGVRLLPMPADPLAPLVAAVFQPAAAPRLSRLRPVVIGRPRPVRRLPRRRRVALALALVAGTFPVPDRYPWPHCNN